MGHDSCLDSSLVTRGDLGPGSAHQNQCNPLSSQEGALPVCRLCSWEVHPPSKAHSCTQRLGPDEESKMIISPTERHPSDSDLVYCTAPERREMEGMMFSV